MKINSLKEMHFTSCRIIKH